VIFIGAFYHITAIAVPVKPCLGCGMKRFLCIASLILLSSCASMQIQTRPLAALGTVAYLERVPVDVREIAFANLRAAAAKMQLVALSADPTPEILAVALNEIATDAAWYAVASALVRAYVPAYSQMDTASSQVALINLSEGIIDTVTAYENRHRPTK